MRSPVDATVRFCIKAADMIHKIRRRLGQVRRVGTGATCRIVASRARRTVVSLIDDWIHRIVPSGIQSWRHEKVPGRILIASRRDHLARWIPSPSGSIELLGTASGGAARRLSLSELPAPWRRDALILDGQFQDGPPSIGWDIDPGSGYRWPARVRSARIRYGNQPGVEVKWPWELGRLQHLPAAAAGIFGADPAASLQSVRMVRDHVIDFIRSNPPGFGVQWLCPMDVGIRIANVLVAVDIARASGIGFDKTFLALVSATARDHGRHIARNLEWGERLCSNHYLANIAGLLYVGAYLRDDPESSEWLAFAGREMIHQIRAQFHAEGSNFEASTCYHRLSSEMAIHSAALMLWISRNQPERASRWWSGRVRSFHPSPAAPPTPRIEWLSGLSHPFDDELRRRLWGMGRFTESLCRADGTIPQIGDNDSGRFMRLEMSDRPYADIDDHRHLVRASRALFGMCGGDHGPESSWISRWLGDAVLPSPPDSGSPHWPEFGLYVWRRQRACVTFRCGHVGQLGNGGHAHCDQLSITLSTADGPIIDDPGTGVYTPRPEVRNELRSSSCHSTVLVPGREQGEWLPGRWGLFAMRDLAKARLLWVNENGAEAEMFLGEDTVRRQVELGDRCVRIIDRAPAGSVANFVLAPGVVVQSAGDGSVVLLRGSTTLRMSGAGIRIDDCPWSSRYGHLSRTTRIRAQAGTCVLEIL
jgi:hypothetical protein